MNLQRAETMMPVRDFLKIGLARRYVIAGLLDYGYVPTQIGGMVGVTVSEVERIMRVYKYKAVDGWSPPRLPDEHQT